MKKPGASALTRMRGEWLCAMYTASHCVKLPTAAFAAAYAGMRVRGRTVLMDAMLRIVPSPRATMPRPNTWQGSSVPRKFRSNTARMPSSVRSKKVGASHPPAAYGPVLACG